MCVWGFQKKTDRIKMHKANSILSQEGVNGNCQVFVFFRRVKLLRNFDFGKLFPAIFRKTTYRIETEFLSQWKKKMKMEKQQINLKEGKKG